MQDHHLSIVVISRDFSRKASKNVRLVVCRLKYSYFLLNFFRQSLEILYGKQP